MQYLFSGYLKYWHKTKKLNCQKSIHNFFVTGDSATPGSTRGGSRTAKTSKMEYFVIIVDGLQPLTIITKRSILDVAAVLDPPLRHSPEIS